MRKIILFLAFSLLGMQLTAQCFQDRHSSVAEDGWLSCDTSTNPAGRADSHWILYDLGDMYQLGAMHVWNMNAHGQTDAGIKTAVIDYSLDGQTWTEWGNFELEEANSSGFYEGQTGPDLENLVAQYLLITILETHGNVCAGFSELKIETQGIISSTDELAQLNQQNLSVFPNPADQMTEIVFESSIAGQGQIKINDASGRLVFEKDIQIRSGKNKEQLDVSQLIAGQYTIHLNINRQVQSSKLTIIHQN